MTIRLLLADDQAMVRQGFGALLNAQNGMLVVGEAPTARTPYGRAGRCSPTSS
jgi:DNA-binding NarL/FixJ family response regulator